MAEPLFGPANEALMADAETIARQISARERERTSAGEAAVEGKIAEASRVAAEYRAGGDVGAAARVELRRARLVALLTNIRVGPAQPRPADD